jgi:hypothetical protein
MNVIRVLPLALLLVACSSLLPTPVATGIPTLIVQPDAAVDGPGVSLAEAIRRPGEGLLVNGQLLILPDGTSWLCEALGESMPPSCSGARLALSNLDAATGLPRLASGGGAQWSDAPVQLLGTVTAP